MFVLPLLLQITTGMALVFRPELVGGSIPEAAAINGAPAPFASSVAEVRANYPDHQLLRADFPTREGLPLVFHVRGNDGGGSTTFVEVDPATGQVIREQGVLSRVLDVVRAIHDELSLPVVGPFVVALGGCSLLVLALSGFIVWWPGVGRLSSALRWPRRGPTRQILFLWHRSSGAVAGVLLTGVALTGVPLSLNSWLADTPWSQPPVALIARTADDRLSASRTLFPELRIRDVRFRAGAVERVLLHDTRYGLRRPVSQVRFDALTGAVTGVVDARRLSSGDAVMAWLYPLHTGQAGGLAGRLLLLLLGLAAAVIGVTGVWLWWVRRPMGES